MLATAEHTTHPAVEAAHRAMATARKPVVRKLPALDRAIAEADAFMQGEFARANAVHSAAEKAAVRCGDGLKDKAKAAEAAVLVPSVLCFPTDPTNQLVRMEFHYADGRSHVSEYVREGFTPSDRGSLLKHCLESGLKPKRYLAVWDQWKKAQSDASDAVMPEEWHVAQRAFEVAEKDWDAALDKQRNLALAIINARITTAAEAVCQIDAYARTMQIDDPAEFADHEDALIIAASLIKSLRRLAQAQ